MTHRGACAGGRTARAPDRWPGALAPRSPEGIRTLATAVRGRRPGPLDDGAVLQMRRWCFLAGVPGLEPRLTEPETVGLPITPYPMECSARAYRTCLRRLKRSGPPRRPPAGAASAPFRAAQRSRRAAARRCLR